MQLLASLITVADSTLMHSEADSFRSSLDPAAATWQATALSRAIDGDTGDFQAIRNGRNTPSALSDNVEARFLTPAMRLYEPKNCKNKKLPMLIYFHGGGWCMGSINSCAAYCDAMAATGKMRVMAVDYCLAPENPFPAGLNDCIRALEYVKEHSDELLVDSIAVGGDSSGGNLALATALSRPGMVSKLLLFYPVTKGYDDGSDSWRRYRSGYGLDGDVMTCFNRAYRHSQPIGTELIDIADMDSTSLAVLPPTLLIAAGHDILCDQGKALAAKCNPEKFQRIEFGGAVHLFITVKGQPTAFSKAVAIGSRFITGR